MIRERLPRGGGRLGERARRLRLGMLEVSGRRRGRRGGRWRRGCSKVKVAIHIVVVRHGG